MPDRPLSRATPRWPRMTVGRLMALLSRLPADAQVVVDYDAGCCRDEDLDVTVDGDVVVIVTDASIGR